MKLSLKKLILSVAILGLSQLGWADHFTIGALKDSESSLPTGENQSLPKKLKTLLNVLQRQTGDTFSVTIYGSPKQLAAALANGKIDIAYGKVATYFHAMNMNSNVKVLAIPYYPEEGQLTYSADFIVAKQNNSINTWQDLKNKTVVFPNRYSLSGIVYPLAFLKEQGINFKDFFKSYYFAGSKQSIMTEILKGHADAGIIWDDIFTHYPQKDKFKVIYKINNIPNPPLMGGSHLSDEQVKKIQADLKLLPKNSLQNYYIAGFDTDTPAGFYDKASQKINELKKLDSSLVE